MRFVSLSFCQRSLWLLSAIMVIAGCMVLLDVLALHGLSFIGWWTALVTIPTFAIAFRCFFSSFSELYQISKKRLIVAGVLGFGVSSLIFPVIFLPLLYVILRLQELWKTILQRCMREHVQGSQRSRSQPRRGLSFAPFGACGLSWSAPTACAVGCILSPLLRLGLIRLGGISFRIEFEWGSAYETAGSSPPLRAGSE
jgi:hypothetical protein